jgi:hypothetical protein
MARVVRREKEIKRIHIGKEEVKVSLFSDNMILCLRDTEHSIAKTLHLINTFSKIAGYRINIQKLESFSIYL